MPLQHNTESQLYALLHYTAVPHYCNTLLQHTTAHATATHHRKSRIHPTAPHYCAILLQRVTATRYCNTILNVYITPNSTTLPPHTSATRYCNTILYVQITPYYTTLLRHTTASHCCNTPLTVSTNPPNIFAYIVITQSNPSIRAWGGYD